MGAVLLHATAAAPKRRQEALRPGCPRARSSTPLPCCTMRAAHSCGRAAPRRPSPHRGRGRARAAPVPCPTHLDERLVRRKRHPQFVLKPLGDGPLRGGLHVDRRQQQAQPGTHNLGVCTHCGLPGRRCSQGYWPGQYACTSKAAALMVWAARRGGVAQPWRRRQPSVGSKHLPKYSDRWHTLFHRESSMPGDLELTLRRRLFEPASVAPPQKVCRSRCGMWWSRRGDAAVMMVAGLSSAWHSRLNFNGKGLALLSFILEHSSSYRVQLYKGTRPPLVGRESTAGLVWPLHCSTTPRAPSV